MPVTALPTLRARKPARFVLDTASVQLIRRGEIDPSIEALLDFETDIGWCHGHVRRRNPGGNTGEWVAWTVFTALEDLKGHEEKAASQRPTMCEQSGKFIMDNLSTNPLNHERSQPSPAEMVVNAVASGSGPERNQHERHGPRV